MYIDTNAVSRCPPNVDERLRYAPYWPAGPQKFVSSTLPQAKPRDVRNRHYFSSRRLISGGNDYNQHLKDWNEHGYEADDEELGSIGRVRERDEESCDERPTKIQQGSW